MFNPDQSTLYADIFLNSKSLSSVNTSWLNPGLWWANVAKEAAEYSNIKSFDLYPDSPQILPLSFCLLKVL